jgi:hypothetical protein
MPHRGMAQGTGSADRAGDRRRARLRPIPDVVLVAASSGLAGFALLVAPDPGPMLEGRQALVVATAAASPTVALTADGAAVVAWVGTGDGDPGVYAARVDDAGVPAAIRLSDPGERVGSHPQSPPQVRVAPGGALFVAWQSVRPSGGRFPASHLWVSRSSDGGRSFEPAVLVNRPAGPDATNGFHDLVAGPDGTLHVSWIAGAGGHGSGEPPEVRVARSVDGGRSFLPAVVVDTAPCPCCRTALAAGPGGTVHVAWRHRFDDGARDIAAAASSDGGRSFGPAVRVARDRWDIDACPHAGPAIAVNDQGGLSVAWFTGGTGRAAVYHSRSAGPGRFRPPSPLTAMGSPTAQVRLASGSAVHWVAWEVAGGDASPEVRVARTARGVPRALPARGLYGRDPAIAAGGDRLALAWSAGDSIRLLVAPLGAAAAGRTIRPADVAGLRFGAAPGRQADRPFFRKPLTQQAVTIQGPR